MDVSAKWELCFQRMLKVGKENWTTEGRKWEKQIQKKQQPGN